MISTTMAFCAPRASTGPWRDLVRKFMDHGRGIEFGGRADAKHAGQGKRHHQTVPKTVGCFHGFLPFFERDLAADHLAGQCYRPGFGGARHARACDRRIRYEDAATQLQHQKQIYDARVDASLLFQSRQTGEVN